ncbi:hypothetical protein M758_UG070100 [Ceratodon purpureus]|nr:hypothetical protein M758_UG070100 [Ceratodon purpureus]
MVTLLLEDLFLTVLYRVRALKRPSACSGTTFSSRWVCPHPSYRVSNINSVNQSRLGLSQYPCGCRRCRGARVRKVETVGRHHRRYGRDFYLPHPVLIVDGVPLEGPVQNGGRGEPYSRWRNRNGRSPTFP